MKAYKNYIQYLLRKSNKSFGEYMIIQGILMGLAFLTSLVAVYLMGYSGGFKAALIIGVFDVVPIIGNGLYLCYQIIYNLIKQEPLIASNLAVLYLTILCVRSILEPKLLGRALNFKFVIIIVIAVIFRILFKQKGLAIIAIIIFILNTLMLLNNIYSLEQKRKIREKKERRNKIREERKHGNLYH